MIKRSKLVYLADALVDVEVENEIVQPGGHKRRVRHVVTVAGERRGNGRVLTFPRPTVQFDQLEEPVSVTLHIRSWLVNDGVVGTLPLCADTQRAARVAADAFALAVQHDVVDTVPTQVQNWCEWYVREHQHVELIVGWAGRVRHVEPLVEPVNVFLPSATVHVEGVLVEQRGPFTPAIDPDSIVAPDQGTRQPDADQAPELAHTTTEVGK